MTEATAAKPEPAQGLDEQVARAIAAVEAGTEIARQAIEGRGDLIELVMWSARLAELGRDIRQAEMFRAIGEQAALAPAPQPARRRKGRHARIPRPRNASPGDGQGVFEFPAGGRLAGVAAAAIAALKAAAKGAGHAAKHAVVHSWAAHPVWTAAAGTAAAGTTAVVLTAAVVTLAPAAPAHSAAAGTYASAGAPGLYGAVPISPGLVPIVTQAAMKTKTGKADTQSAGLVAAPVPAPASSAPSSSQPSPSWTPPPPPGTLVLTGPDGGTLTSGGSLDLGVAPATGDLTATVTITASGGTDSYRAWVTGPGTITPWRGRLDGGQAVTLTLDIPQATADAGGSADLDVRDATGQLQVITLQWEVPAPSPSPTPTPSPLSS